MRLTFQSRGVPLLSNQVRSGKLSVSDILNVHYQKVKEADKQAEFAFPGLIALGLAVQMYVEEWKRSQGHIIVCDIEVEKDGITGHPDINDFTIDCVTECKATTRRAPIGYKLGEDITPLLYDSSLEDYFAQLACYMEMREVKRGELIVCYLKGDYSGIEAFWDSYILEDAEEYTNGIWRLVSSYRDVLCKGCKKMYCTCLDKGENTNDSQNNR
jgi:hypothetical protein